MLRQGLGNPLMMKMLLSMLIQAAAVILRILSPLRSILGRICYSALLKADVPDLDPSVQCDGPVRIIGTKNIKIGCRCRFGRETEFETEESGGIIIGDDVRINRGCTVVSYSRISIGDFSIIGEYVSIRDANHGMDLAEPMRYQKHSSSPIMIGRDVWIGRGSCILPGVAIGEGSVIGANSVVTADIPPFSIAAGVPAKVVKKRP